MARYYGIAMSEYDKNSLRHFGILGQKWGVRRYQNSDGTYTEAGKKRYAKYTRLADNSFKNAKNDKYFREQAEAEGKRRGEAWRNYGMGEARWSKSAKKYQDKANKYAFDPDKRDMEKMLNDAGITEKYSKKNLQRADTAEVRAGWANIKESADEMERRSIEAFNTALGDEHLNKQRDEKSKNDKPKTDVLMIPQSDGSGRAIEYKKFDDKIDKKLRRDYGSDKEIKRTTSEMKKIFEQLGIDLTQAFGNGGIKNNSFSSKSDSEQLYIMLRLGESLGLIEIPNGTFD